MGRAARGYSWPPFERGNEAAVRHGVWRAERAEVVAADVAELAEETAVTFPWTRPYIDERLAYARAIVDERDVRAYLDEVGVLDEDHQERPAVRTLERFSRIAASRRRDLGLSPMAHARILALVAEVVARHPDRLGPLDSALDTLLAEGRAALDRTAEFTPGTQEP